MVYRDIRSLGEKVPEYMNIKLTNRMAHESAFCYCSRKLQIFSSALQKKSKFVFCYYSIFMICFP